MKGSLDLDTGETAQHTLHPEFKKDDHGNPSLMALPLVTPTTGSIDHLD